MTWLWIPITVFASFVQAIRTAAQKHLTAELTTISTTFVRFLFGLPFVLAYLFGLKAYFQVDIPPLPGNFLAIVALAGLAQVVATALLIYLFGLRNFAVGTTYARTEAFLTAMIGAAFFGEAIVLFGWVGVFISVVGVVLITIAKTGVGGRQLVALLRDKAAWIGILSGACFAIASLSIRKGNLILGVENFLFTAAVTLSVMLIMQTVVMFVYLLITKPRQFLVIARNWKVCVLVGITSMMGSAAWATAFALQNASYVKALAQVEFVFTLAVSFWFFKEASTSKELTGMALVVLGIIVLVLFG